MGVIGQQKIIYVTQALTWSDAQVYCRQHYIDLVTVRTTGDNDQLYEDTWLGMYRDNSSSAWKWSRGDEPNTFNNEWKTDPNYEENCIYKSSRDGGRWRTDKCNEIHEFYCLDDSLFLERQMKTWEEALVHCRSLSSGNRRYDLATVLTLEDHDFVKSQITNQVRPSAAVQCCAVHVCGLCDVQVWTGLRFLGDRWVWVGGEKVQYNDITTCPESKRCGVVDKMTNQLYNIANCEEQRKFFCYRKSSAV
ncbi:hypothetical protein NL108_016631 [Boleophthalmus pectinirostris]|nr:hypothetical protein NL108_016631 [Boleophthalmus pectinirostris]